MGGLHLGGDGDGGEGAVRVTMEKMRAEMNQQHFAQHTVIQTERHTITNNNSNRKMTGRKSSVFFKIELPLSV